MKYILGNQGFTRRVYLLLIVLLLLIAVPFASPYYRYYALVWHTNNTIKLNAGNHTLIRKKIMSYAMRNKIPLSNKNLSVSRDGRKVKVRIYWTDSVDHFGYHQKPVTFIINDEF
jgi:hypothetical protein